MGCLSVSTFSNYWVFFFSFFRFFAFFFFFCFVLTIGNFVDTAKRKNGDDVHLPLQFISLRATFCTPRTDDCRYY